MTLYRAGTPVNPTEYVTRDREIVQLRADGLSYREIGKRYGISAARATQIVSAARKKEKR